MSTHDQYPPTMSVRGAAELLGIGLRQAYEAVHRGEIPAIRVGRRLIVPTSRLLELIGLPAADYLRPPNPDEAA